MFGLLLDCVMKSAVCVLVKNEQDDIGDWIAHHLRLGFSTALVYDNGSTDGTCDAVRGAAADGDVRLLSWSGGPGTQRAAYMEAMLRHAGEFDWIAVLDADEYLVLHRDRSVAEFCAAAPGWADAIVVNWAMFGSNGYVARPALPVPAAFTRRAPDDFGPNRHVKSLVRPASVRGCCNAHAFEVAQHTVRPGGQAVQWMVDEAGVAHGGLTADRPDYGVAQVNHYFTRSRAHWAARLARGNFSCVRSWDDFAAYDRNEVEDLSILRWRSIPARAEGMDPPVRSI